MRGMNNPTTSLASIQKDFPFESRLSLTLLIKFWEDLAKADTAERGAPRVACWPGCARCRR